MSRWIVVGMTLALSAMLVAIGQPTAMSEGRAPEAPSARAQPGVNQFSVLWSAPNDHGSAIRRYEVQTTRIANLIGPWSSRIVPGSFRSTTFTNMTNGAFVGVRVRAQNASGWGPWNTNSLRITVGAPTSVPGTTALSRKAGAVVSWRAAGPNAARITDYLVAYRYRVGDRWALWVARGTSANARSVTLTGLTSGRLYQFCVFGRNAYSDGPRGSVVTLRVG